MKLLLVLLATAYASGPGDYGGYESIGYDQLNFDRYSYGYGSPKDYGEGLITVPVPYVVGRQGIGFDKRTAFAYGFRMPLTLELLEVLRRYPEKYLEKYPERYLEKYPEKVVKV